MRVFFDDGVFFYQGIEFVALIYLGGIRSIFFIGEIIFSATSDTTGGGIFVLTDVLVAMTNDGVGSYDLFNLQKRWLMCFRRHLLPRVVEYIVLLMRSPQLWSLLLVENAIVVVGSSEVPW